MTVLSSGIHAILAHVLVKYTGTVLVTQHISLHSGHFM
jgi:hypothetical protein